MAANAKPSRVGLISLGCAKNLVDSEILLGELERAGHAITPNLDEAETVIVNTCAFIDDAKRESIDGILGAGEALERRGGGKLIVTGCLAQRYGTELELERRLDEAVGELPPSYRQLILLRHRGQHRYDDIARITKLPIGTVKNRIFRAREILRSQLADLLDEGSLP